MSDLNTPPFKHRSKFWLLAAGSMALGLTLFGCFGTDDDAPPPTTDPCKADASLCTPRKTLLDTGKSIFEGTCNGCHGSEGRGNPGGTPPLANSNFFMNNRHKVIRIVLGGYQDSVYVNGLWYHGQTMPAWGGQYSNVELAGVLTYLRAKLNDSTVTECFSDEPFDDNGFPVCTKVPRAAADTAMDSVAAWEIKPVRDSICAAHSAPTDRLGCYNPQ